MVILCQECHDKVDRDQIIINGWVETSAGIKFDYHIKTEEKISKTKYSPVKRAGLTYSKVFGTRIEFLGSCPKV